MHELCGRHVLGRNGCGKRERVCELPYRDVFNHGWGELFGRMHQLHRRCVLERDRRECVPELPRRGVFALVGHDGVYIVCHGQVQGLDWERELRGLWGEYVLGDGRRDRGGGVCELPFEFELSSVEHGDRVVRV